MGSLSSEDLSASGPTRISFFVPEMYSSLEESIDTAITVSGKSFQIPVLMTSSRNQSESVSPSGNMNNPQKKGVQGTSPAGVQGGVPLSFPLSQRGGVVRHR